MKKFLKRAVSGLLVLVLLIGMLPVSTFAAEGAFVLAVEAGGVLVVAPEYVFYSEGQTVRQALQASGHTFTGLEEGWITAIDEITGNFKRSDEHGGFDLDAPASEVNFYRFCEDADAQPSQGLQQLMTAMAEYDKKDEDVQSAAWEAYEAAYTQFVGIDSDSAALLAEEILTAIREYEENQSGDQHQVLFTDMGGQLFGADIEVKNAQGKTWTDDGDGVLELPAGDYSFRVRQDGLMAEGSFGVSGELEIALSMPAEPWLDLDRFRVSGSYGSEDNEDNRFSDEVFSLSGWSGREATAAVLDTFAGTVYTYAEYNADLVSGLPTFCVRYRNAKTGEQTRQELPFESLTSGAAHTLASGAAGNTAVYQVSSHGEDGYLYTQEYTVNFTRVPTLAGISVTDQNGVDQIALETFSGTVMEYTYKVLSSVTSVNVIPQPFAAGYSVTVNGQPGGSGVELAVSRQEQTEITIQVSANGYSSTYVLTILPGEGKKLSFVTDRADVTLEVVNKNGEVMPYEKFKEGTSGNRYQYVLIPGEAYSYVATAAGCYHLADEFVMEDVADSTIRVDVPTEDWLTSLAFGNKASASYKGSLPLDEAFTPENHAYTVSYIDMEHLVYLWGTTAEAEKIEVLYDQVHSSSLYHGVPYSIDVIPGAKTGTQLKRFLMDENPLENTAVIRLSMEQDGVTCYQDYIVEFRRELTLQDLQAQTGGVTISLVQENGKTGFAPAVKDYSVTVSMAAEALDLAFSGYTGNPCYGETDVGYRISVDGTELTEAGSCRVSLDGTMNTQYVTVTVENPKAPEGAGVYTLTILKSPPVEVSFDLTPGNAVLAVYETMSGERFWADDAGRFQFCEGYRYRYTATAVDHVSRSGILEVTRNAEGGLVILDGEESYSVELNEGGGSTVIVWELEEVPPSDAIDGSIPSEWPNFRGSNSNNGVISAPVPTAAEDGTLYWANQIGSGIDADAVGSPILVDGDLITYASNKLYRVDTVTGQIKQTGTMDHKSSFSITPPTYAEGMVFVALSNGTIQAFNADTLESLWIYEDPLGGQPNCPLTVHNGLLYTGFWNSETGDANFVCMTITDEDPGYGDENKAASWYHTAKGGYYWAGAYACDDFVLIGTDDGTNSCTGQSSRMLAFDPVTGRLLDSWDGLNGDIRCSVVYDSATNAYYFTSKGGSFYSLQMSRTETGWKMTNCWSADLQNSSGGTPMSTSSPVVYNGRAYVGVSGAGQFAAYSGHNITVIDLKAKAIAYSVSTQGYPQTSGMLTTAYEKTRGYVYVYFFDNMTPGKLRVLRDKPGQKSADFVTQEGSHSSAYALFTPTGDHAQYAICSPVADEYGTVYFKNDSAYLMAFGSAIRKIEITRQPDRLAYREGECFDPSGMVVTATYANGMERDVTAYVTFDTAPLALDATQITISFPHVLYHNTESGASMNSGTPSATPYVDLEITVGRNLSQLAFGDVNGDGAIDILDANLILSSCNGLLTLTQDQQAQADANEDGRITSADAQCIVAYFYGRLGNEP